MEGVDESRTTSSSVESAVVDARDGWEFDGVVWDWCGWWDEEIAFCSNWEARRETAEEPTLLLEEGGGGGGGEVAGDWEGGRAGLVLQRRSCAGEERRLG
jgi:hypothetical protein